MELRMWCDGVDDVMLNVIVHVRPHWEDCKKSANNFTVLHAFITKLAPIDWPWKYTFCWPWKYTFCWPWKDTFCSKCSVSQTKGETDEAKNPCIIKGVLYFGDTCICVQDFVSVFLQCKLHVTLAWPDLSELIVIINVLKNQKAMSRKKYCEAKKKWWWKVPRRLGDGIATTSCLVARLPTYYNCILSTTTMFHVSGIFIHLKIDCLELDTSVDRDRIAYYTNDVNSTNNNQSWKSLLWDPDAGPSSPRIPEQASFRVDCYWS